jgi:hypothetical protein
MTTEINSTAPASGKPKTQNPKPKTVKTTPGNPTASYTGLSIYPRYTGKIPAEITGNYPELGNIANRLHGYGYSPTKFFLSYAPDLKKPNNRTGEQFYITPSGKISSPPKNHADYNKSARLPFEKPGIFSILFPETKSLFSRIIKNSGGNITLNISYAPTSNLNTRREYILTYSLKP